MNVLWNKVVSNWLTPPDSVAKEKQIDAKVADISLAAWGHKEIAIAEHEMPGIMAVLKEY